LKNGSPGEREYNNDRQCASHTLHGLAQARFMLSMGSCKKSEYSATHACIFSSRNKGLIL
jgi:hypothetical protein